jgi:GT2 family glycosyltransferase
MRGPIGQSLGSVTVVIPHRGPDKGLELCLLALRKQSYPRMNIETIVVVNEPVDRTLDFSLEPDESVLWQPNYYSYAARNTGIARASGEIIAFTDSDCIPDHDWIRAGVEAITQGADMVAGRVDLAFSSKRLSPAACYEKLFAFDQEKNAASGYSATANLIVRTSLFRDIGVFDEEAQTGADFEWTSRAVSHGSSITYEPGAVVRHPARETMEELFAKARRTSSLWVGASRATGNRVATLRDRLRHQLFVPPSPRKRGAMTGGELVLAQLVRVIVLAYKAFCLLGAKPAGVGVITIIDQHSVAASSTMARAKAV